jgi:hypothetical protein
MPVIVLNKTILTKVDVFALELRTIQTDICTVLPSKSSRGPAGILTLGAFELSPASTFRIS